MFDDGQRGAAALDRVQAAAAPKLAVHSGASEHVGLLLDVKLAVVKLLLVADERRQRSPPASGVCSEFPSKKHGFIFGIGL